MSLNDVFSAVLLDHYRHPRHSGELENPDAESLGANPLCGDEINIQIKTDGDRLTDIGFTGHSCAICTASTSIFCERSVESDFGRMDGDKELFYRMIHGESMTEAERERLGEFIALEGVAKLPSRVKCATLVWETWELMRKKMNNEK